jgi:NAD+ synthase
MELADKIATWLKEYAVEVGAKGYVVGLSGGIDSACAAALCQRAMGENVLAAWLPCHSLEEDACMASLVAEAFGLRMVQVDLGPAYDALLAAMPSEPSAMARANIKPRLRMLTLYSLAQTNGYLVAGTSNKTEWLVGYFTKYGDGGADVEPLADLYKCQVRELARYLDVPQPVRDRPPTAGLWAGQTDEDEMGIRYDDLDAALVALETGQAGDVAPALLDKVRRMMAASEHKRMLPPSCWLDA